MARKKGKRKVKHPKPVKGRCPKGFHKNKVKIKGHKKGTICVRSRKKGRKRKKK